MSIKHGRAICHTKERSIDGMRYIVTCTSSENARETAEDKLVKLITDRVANEFRNGDFIAFAEDE